jgi:Fe-S cluster assembly protein SufD
MSGLEKNWKQKHCNIPNLETIRIENINNSICFDDTLQKEINGKIFIEQDSKTKDIIIRIKDNVVIEKPLQILNLLEKDTEEEKTYTTKIIIGENSQLTIINCDDSISKEERHLIHNINIEMNSYSCLTFYKMENINNSSSLNTNMVFDVKGNARLSTFCLSLNGGSIKNNLRVNFNEEHSEADLNGLYLMDKEQMIDTQMNVYHYKSNCKSHQLFKGIADDNAVANFIGHILVDYNAVNTIAMQVNNNILLTDKAKVNTRPFLEIYNDDVQCSHGATIGQLDDNALYYLRTRGINERNAKMLLMNAFCQSVISKSEITALKESLSEIIQRRLHGDLSDCSSCVFECKNETRDFHIDKTKL